MRRKDLNVYFIAGSQDVPNGNLYAVLEEALQAGVTMFQFREKGQNSLEEDPVKKRELAIKCQELCREYQIPFVVNDDVELALAIKADGIHVGQEDAPIKEVLRRVSPDTIVGLSTSNAQEVAEAETVEGLDYIGLGPVFTTSSKDNTDPELGIEGMTKIIGEGRSLPVVAIGGISAENAAEVRKAGVDGVSVISAIARSENISHTIEQLKENSFE